MMIDVAIAIDGEARDVSLIIRAAGAYDEDGNFDQGSATTTTIRAAIFPASGNQLRDMPEGIRTEAGWVAWSRTSMAVENRIVDGSITYRVLFVWPRPEGGFTRAALGRVTP